MRKIQSYILLLITAVIMFPACRPAQEPEPQAPVAITFSSSFSNSGSSSNNAPAAAPAAGAAVEQHNSADEQLNRKFFVYGVKTHEEGADTSVFCGTSVTFSDDSWKYEELQNWDMTAKQYTFMAYSLGAGVTDGENTTYASIAPDPEPSINGFTINGSKDQLLTCYFTNQQLVEKESFGQTVDLTFCQLAAKVCLRFYSSIDGCTVKDLTYTLSTETKVFPTKGPYSVTYSDRKAVLTHAVDLTEENINVTNTMSLKALEEGSTIGSSAANASSTGDCLVLPMLAPATKLKIEVKYKTVTTNSGVESDWITKTGVLCNAIDWQYQHRYVYLLNITAKGIDCIPFTEDWDDDYRH